MSKDFHEFPYAIKLFDKDISEYSKPALCSEQLEQLFCVYIGYMGSQITWSVYNFVVGIAVETSDIMNVGTKF